MPVLVVEVDIDPAKAKERVANRAEQGGHDVSLEKFERFINDYSSFSEYGYQSITVNGEENVSANAKIIKQEIEKLKIS